MQPILSSITRAIDSDREASWHYFALSVLVLLVLWTLPLTREASW